MGYKETALGLHLMYPLNFVAFSRGFTSSHRGVDIAWNDEHGGPNMPIYAPADGEVVARVDGMGNTYYTGIPDWGNYVKIKHATGVYTLMAHMLKGSVLVSVGQKVKRGQQIGRMGNTGYSNGCHTHTEVYVGGSGTSYRVNPVDYMFAYPNQSVHPGDKKEYGIKTYTPVKEVGTPVARNVMVDQLEVITDTLRARKTAGLKGEILGYVRVGIYNVKEIKEVDDYKWYNCGEFWCANNKEETWCHFLPTEYIGKTVARDEQVNQIEVTATTLRARELPSLKGQILGFANRGFYNCDDQTIADGYKWFKISKDEGNFWVAQSKDGDWVKWLPKKNPHYDFTMKAINEDQKNEMVKWCKDNAIEYTFNEV